jgi:aspartyl-tRNA(Asn)/glutamyl-tRNA(Gln) amidotransferase subunit A
MTPVETYQTDICTLLREHRGLPAVPSPAASTRRSLPVGLQLIGDKFGKT